MRIAGIIINQQNFKYTISGGHKLLTSHPTFLEGSRSDSNVAKIRNSVSCNYFLPTRNKSSTFKSKPDHLEIATSELTCYKYDTVHKGSSHRSYHEHRVAAI